VMGAICGLCGQEMQTAKSCIRRPFAEAPTIDPVRWGDEPQWRGIGEHRCPDCGVQPGGYHHQFCDMECHPQTGAQVLSGRYARVLPDGRRRH